jgi:hypothetical protein
VDLHKVESSKTSVKRATCYGGCRKLKLVKPLGPSFAVYMGHIASVIRELWDGYLKSPTLPCVRVLEKYYKLCYKYLKGSLWTEGGIHKVKSMISARQNSRWLWRSWYPWVEHKRKKEIIKQVQAVRELLWEKSQWMPHLCDGFY